jgi:uncharacterized protein
MALPTAPASDAARDSGQSSARAVGRDVNASIARLFVYPVKSCAGVELKEAVLTETGLDLDGAWMVVDADGVFVSQREQARLALVKPQLKMEELILRAPGMLALHVRIDAVEQPATVRVWDDTVPAFDMGNIAAQWFSDFLSLNQAGLPASNAKKYRMVRFDPDHKRLSSMKWTQGAEALNQFSDGFPVLVISTASLDGLNSKLAAAGHAAVGIERFRPNIVLAGLDAHDEDRLQTLHVALEAADMGTAGKGVEAGEAGEVILKPVKPCQRCPIPNIDPATASSSPEVGDMLQSYRKDARVEGRITFGMNAIVLQGVDTVLRVGQAVTGDFSFD